MSPHEFLMSVTLIFAIMGMAALIELAAPLFSRTPEQRGRSAVNLELTVLTLAVNWAIPAVAAILALALSLQAPGLVTRLGLPIAVQIVASVVVLDFFFGYVAHRALHMSPTLWRVHRVHHSDPFVDVTTTYRNHPLESLWRLLFVIVPVWILGLPAEGVVIYRLLSALNAILEHANIRVWGPLDRAVSLVWVTPNMHKVHHSRDFVETDTNYGNILSVYDRMLRTFTPTDRAFSVVYGLDDADPARAKSLPGLLAMPFQSESEAREPAQISGVEEISA